MTAAAVTATGVGGTLMTVTAAAMTAAAVTATGVGGTVMTTTAALTTAAAVTATGVGGTVMTTTAALTTAAAVTATGVGGTVMTTTAALTTAAAVTATGVGGTVMTTTAALTTAARAGEAELTAARVAGPLLTAAGTHTAPEAAVTDAAARMLPVAATPSGVTVGNAAVAAAIDDDATAHSPMYRIPAPEGRHDRPRWTPGPTDPGRERAESEITGREVNRGILSPWPRTIDHGRVVIGRINDVRVGRRNSDVGPVVSTRDLVVRCQVSRFLCLVAQELDLRHDIALLMGKGDAQRICPIEIFVEHRDDGGERGDRLDARVPIHRLQGGDERVALERGVARIIEPARRLDDLQRKGRRHENLRHQLIGVERDRREHLIQFLLGIGIRFRVDSRWRDRARRRARAVRSEE